MTWPAPIAPKRCAWTASRCASASSGKGAGPRRIGGARLRRGALFRLRFVRDQPIAGRAERTKSRRRELSAAAQGTVEDFPGVSSLFHGGASQTSTDFGGVGPAPEVRVD